MVKIPTKNERYFLAMRFASSVRMHRSKFKTYLHQHEFEAPKNIEKTEIHCNNWN
jgi:CPA2 family monovalent cation:H+ antiporter-2